MRSFDVTERRARLARRHHLAHEARADTVEAATRGLVCLHATDPATVFLSARARMGSMAVAELEHALYRDRSLVKHLAMRRTLFVVPREVLPVVQAGASVRVADTETRRLVRDVEKAGLVEDGERWLTRAQAAVLDALADGREATSSELREEIDLLRGAITYGEGRRWGGEAPVGPRVLTTLSARGKVVRASNDGTWTASRPRWAITKAWLGEEPAVLDERAGRAELVRLWLGRFGPGTLKDLKWWLGSTVAAVRTAVTDVGAVEVDLAGQTGYVLPDDLEPDLPVEPWAALLPGLDPTTMGWFERDWYLGPHRADLFDSNGNGGATAWWGGRVVGGWHQGSAGEVVVDLLEEVDARARTALEQEAGRLTEWLGGVRVAPRFPSPLSLRSGRT
ncbi:MAG TPA: winged helix DNA-binding domain-containing protein [Nocardioidaceae bacterium]|nr:winged helix DNA-binding domain-containing protein [Nocardioidaceae bacterium]